MIDFKQVLQALISGENFSAHALQIDVSGELGPKHGAVVGDPPCDFCSAWRAVKTYLSMNLRPQFEPGDKVLIEGGVKGRVMSVEELVRVEVQGERGHGPYVTGTFRPEALSPAPPPITRTFWMDRHGDVWERDEATDMALLIEYVDNGPVPGVDELRPDPTKWYWTFQQVQKRYGLLAQVKR